MHLNLKIKTAEQHHSHTAFIVNFEHNSHLGFHTYFTHILHTKASIVDSKQVNANWKTFQKSK